MVKPGMYGNGGLSGSCAGDHGLNKSAKLSSGWELSVHDMVDMIMLVVCGSPLYEGIVRVINVCLFAAKLCNC